MKRLGIAIVIGLIAFGTVYAAAAALRVEGATAATGRGGVESCGDVTGSTFVLEGQELVTSGADTAGPFIDGVAADITEFQAVNIETVADCEQLNAFVQVKDAQGKVIATGACAIDADGGMGFDEANGVDNVPGCTAIVGNDTVADDDLPDVEPAVDLVVTMT
jgi:hypothetical protein